MFLVVWALAGGFWWFVGVFFCFWFNLWKMDHFCDGSLPGCWDEVSMPPLEANISGFH